MTHGSQDDIIGYQIQDDQRVGEGGFLSIRRMHLRAVRRDGSLTDVFLSDYVERRKGLDAVVVALYYQDAAGVVHVLLRRGQRPALHFGRAAHLLPIEEPGPPRLLFTEIVAGIIEEEDRGEEGIRRRAAAEALEEAGYRVDPAQVERLGAPVFPTPGMCAERFHLMAARVDPAACEPPPGDGSPMEEGSARRFVALDEALRLCERGEIEDAKTEIALRRLRDRLG